jgi:fibronectin type 3 domain-containing protein
VGTVTGTSFRDTGLASFTVYEYRVRSVNGDGDEGDPSNVATARTLDGTPPTAPGSFTGSGASQSQISLSWSAASDAQTGIAEYVIYRDGGEIARTTALSYDDGGLEADQVYVYQVSAVNGQGIEGNRSGPIEVRTLSDVAPDPPTGLTAQAVDPSTVDLAWDVHPDDDLDGYRLFRDGSLIAETDGTQYRDAGLDPFTTYVYTVTAVAEDGDESAPSTSATVTTPDDTGPSVPEDLSATAVGTQRVDLSWSPSIDGESGILGYRIFRDGGEIAVTEATIFQDSQLAPGTKYEYRVSAINGAELESGLSDPASATTFDGSGPSVPTGLGATPVSTESIALAWSPSTDSESGIAYYRLFRDGSEIASPAGTDVLDTGLLPGTEYEYRVSAVNGEGLESDLSAAASATTLTDEGPPAPTGVTATPLDESQIRLSWTAPEGGAAGYNVFRDQVFIGTVMATAFVDTGLQPSTTYLYSVASVDSDGIQGPLSGQISATTSSAADLVPPAAPTGLRLITP